MKQIPKWLVAVLLAATVSTSAIAIWALFFRASSEPDVSLVPDYAPEVEENAKPIPNDNSEGQKTTGPGGAVSLTYSDQVTIDLSEKTAALVFANPQKSNHDMVLQIVIQDTVIVQSGRLISGNQVSVLPLLDDVLGKIPVGGYEGKFVIFYYNQETGEKASVNTEIPIVVSVKK